MLSYLHFNFLNFSFFELRIFTTESLKNVKQIIVLIINYINKKVICPFLISLSLRQQKSYLLIIEIL